jgi:hypothetical protein
MNTVATSLRFFFPRFALVCVYVCLFGIWISCSSCSITDPTTTAEAQAARTFLATNNQAVDFNATSSLALFDPVLAEKELFMAGEVHSVAANEELNFLLLRYFRERAGVKYLLPEFSYGFCELINSYLDNGDESLLRWLYERFRGTAAYYNEGFEFWRKLRAYNQTLPPEQRIRVIGTDIEHQNLTGLRYFRTLLPDTPAPASISDALNGVSNLFSQAFTRDQLRQRCETLRASIDANRTIYQQYTGDKFFSLDFMTDNLLQTTDAQARQGNDFNRVRDTYLYANFLRIYSTLPKGKFYGQWGRNHVYQTRPNDDILWNGSMFANDARSPVRGKVLAIPYFYKNCERMVRDGSTERLNDYASPEQVLEPFATGNAHLFRFIATGTANTTSPFSTTLLWLANDTDWKRSGAVTTDYFQYGILIQNSPAATFFAQTSLVR